MATTLSLAIFMENPSGWGMEAGTRASPEINKVPTGPSSRRVFHAATVGGRGGRLHGLPGQARFQGGQDVIARARDIGGFRGGLVVDGAGIGDLALRIDDEHMRGGLGLVGLAHG